MMNGESDRCPLLAFPPAKLQFSSLVNKHLPFLGAKMRGVSGESWTVRVERWELKVERWEVRVERSMQQFHLTGTDARPVRPQSIGNSLLKVRLIKDARTVRPYQPIKHSSCSKNLCNPCNHVDKNLRALCAFAWVISPRITSITRNFIRVIRVISVQKKNFKCIVFLREPRNELSKSDHFIFVVWTQIAQIARILFVRFIDLREVLYPRITRRNSVISWFFCCQRD